MKAVDRSTIERFGIPGERLMDEAGTEAFRVIADYFEPASMLVLAGRGNNGGDGLVVARRASEAGVATQVLLWCEPGELQGEARHHYRLLPEALRPRSKATLRDLEAALHSAPDVVVDALLGIGARGPLRPELADVVQRVNAGGPYASSHGGQRRWTTVAIDIPTGVPADPPWEGGVAIEADLTVTFGALKAGMAMQPGLRHTGRVVVKRISFPPELLEGAHDRMGLLTAAFAGSLIPPRPLAGHKGTFGTCVLLGGAPGMAGAMVLATQAALRSGAGLVRALAPGDVARAVLHAAPAALVEAATGGEWPRTRRSQHLTGEPLPILTAGSLPGIMRRVAAAHALVVGPGMGLHPATQHLLLQLMQQQEMPPILLDADALTILAEAGPEALPPPGHRAPLVLTPHPGEAARLLQAPDTATIQADRVKAARTLASRWHAYVALKGAQTLLATPCGHVEVNPTGNTGLARGGSGDILAGLVGGLMAQGAHPYDALRAGTFLHGLAADLALPRSSPQTLDADTLLQHLGEGFRQLHHEARAASTAHSS
jgi:NAD(P)H-hydrate epimerase